MRRLAASPSAATSATPSKKLPGPANALNPPPPPGPPNPPVPGPVGGCRTQVSSASSSVFWGKFLVMGR